MKLFLMFRSLISKVKEGRKKKNRPQAFLKTIKIEAESLYII